MRDGDDDRRPPKPAAHQIGADLSAVSADELRERIRLLEDEIARLRAEVDRKEASKAAASAFFRTGVTGS